jgi:hypothetical protein
MAVQALREDAPHNPRTVDEARARGESASVFMPWNIDALVDSFARTRRALRHRCGVRGRETLRLFTTRSRRQKNYRRPSSATRGRQLTNVGRRLEDAETGRR